MQSLIGPVKQSADVTSVMSAQEQTNSDLSDMLVLNICWCSFGRKVFVFNVLMYNLYISQLVHCTS